jgi:acetyl esterase/lipase
MLQTKEQWVQFFTPMFYVALALAGLGLLGHFYKPSELLNLQYGPYNAHRRNSLDLYLPADRQPPYPLVIYIHGGAWKIGDKTNLPDISGLRKAGIAVASINYRLLPKAIFPAQIEDCKRAISWLRANAHAYDLDPERFGVWGYSAGGHLAALVGTTGDIATPAWAAEQNGVSNKVSAVCVWSGLSDFLTVGQQSRSDFTLDNVSENAPVSLLIGGKPTVKVKEAREASPVFYVTDQSPPFLIVHGEEDKLVPFEQGKELADALKRHGVLCEFVPVPGTGHAIYSEATLKCVVDFFERVLAQGKKNI